MKKILSAIAFLALSQVGVAQTMFKFGTAGNPQGQTVQVDSKGLILNGKHVLPVMGEMHYSRVPEREWRREIAKMKAGGITVLSTYVFWSHHEQAEGKWNWSGNLSLSRFLQTCKEEQMPVVLRVGPFCHGEVFQGGMADWIVAKAQSDKNYKLRSTAPGFMEATRKLYAQIYGQAKDFLWKNGGTIIGVQIENECRGPWDYYMGLKKMATSIGFDVPFYTRTGWPKLNGGEKEFGQFLPLYGDYADGFWDRVLTDMPGDYAKAFEMKDSRISSVIATETFGTNQDTKMEQKDMMYPYLTCELGGGMMPAYHRRINISGKEIMPLTICKLGSGSNLPGYYMYHGGSNWYSAEHTMAETQASAVTNYNDMPLISYDFQSPLGEMGQLNETAFHESRWLHQFLADWGGELALMDVDTLSAHYARRGCFEFRNDYVRILREQGTASVTPKGMKWEGLTITSTTVQPFAKADGELFFITIKNTKPQLTINGKRYAVTMDKPLKVNGKKITVLSPKTARKAFVIDGRMHYAQHGGVLYKNERGYIVEEAWNVDNSISIACEKKQDAKGLRDVKMGGQKVAAMPVDADFDGAATWALRVPVVTDAEDCFLKITYRGDVARIYADGELIEDNFWNGKPMLVRVSALQGKKVELKVLPMGKNYPIYLQKEQKAELDKAENGVMLKLDAVEVVRSQTYKSCVESSIIDLSGNWQFQMDRNNVGEAEGWATKSLTDKIELPGSMLTRGKGDKVNVNTHWVGSLYDSSFFYNPYLEQFRREENFKPTFFLTPDKHYVGVAWYNRTVDVDKKDAGSRWTLFLERPHIQTTLYVNGKKVGDQRSLSVPHEYDVTDYLVEGKNQIAIRVDNGVDVTPVGQDSHSITDQTQGDWNGIVGKIELRSSAAKGIRHIDVFPDVASHTAKVKLTLTGKKDEVVAVSLMADAFNTAVPHHVAEQTFSHTMQGDEDVCEFVLDMGADVQLWDEFSPALYRLTAKAGNEAKQTTFGVRDFRIDGTMFTCNGREVQLRGTVENCLFPLTGFPPTDYDFWFNLFTTCKEWGLNHVRFHSYCPPEAAFDAADAVGMYLQPEGPSWPNHGVKLGYGHDIDTYLMEETQLMVREYGNHPSFCMMAAGNEPAGRWVEWCSDFVDYWKAQDNRRVYTGASVGGGWAWQPKNEYHVKAGARGLADWTRRAPEAMSVFSKQISHYKAKDGEWDIHEPYVSHETGQWCAFPDFNEIGQYEGPIKAKNFEVFRTILADNGMADRADKFMMASGKLQALCYKYEIEKHLKTPGYAGFQLLSLNDYSGQGTALVGVTNVFWKPKGYIFAPEWREFCAPVVPLARIPKFTYKNTETFTAELSVNNHSKNEVGSLSWQVSDQQGTLIAKGNGNKVSVALAGVAEASKLTLRAFVGADATNHWDFWVYPAEVQQVAGNVYVTDTLDSKALKVLRKGGNVLLCAAGKVKYGNNIVQQFLPVFWNTSWFKMRPPHTTGVYVESEHPVFRSFPTDSYSDLQWWELVNKAQVMQLSEFDKDFQPIVQSIDTWFLSRKIGMLFEAKVLKGKLMMTTMDITNDLDNRVVARQMRKSILDYMNSSDFQPQHTIAPDLINHLFTREAPKVDMYTNESPDELKPKLK